MNRTLLLVILAAGTRSIAAQCPLTTSDTCEVTLDANVIAVSGSQALSGSGQCFHIPSGSSLDYDGINSVFLVEPGGSVNVNGTGNLVIAKSGAAVGFCGSGYANRVNHAGATLSCMMGNAELVCTQVVFHGITGMDEHTARPALWFDHASRTLHTAPMTAGSPITIRDAAGRGVMRTASTGSPIGLPALPPGMYAAVIEGCGSRAVFVVP